MNRFVIIDSEGFRYNTILWDGVTPWDIPEGFTVESEETCTAPSRLVPEEPAPEEPAPEEPAPVE